MKRQTTKNPPSTVFPEVDAASFQERLLERHPSLKDRVERHARKRDLAIQMRVLRKNAGLTQKDVETRSGLTQSAISRIEAPTGAVPQLETIDRFVTACGGRLDLVISSTGR